LVTGAGGFLGSHVAARLALLGATTFGFARKPPSTDNAVCWLAGDLSEASAVSRAIREARPDIVFHLAGQTTAAPDKDLVLPALRNNLLGTVVLMREILEFGCGRFVTTGSLEEPRQGENVVPTSPYGASKWAESVYARMFHALYSLPVTIVRPYMTYGPRQRATKLVPSVALALLQGRAPTVRHPDRQVDWIYVDDVVDGILAAGLAAGAEGLAIDLGSGTLVSIREIAETLQAVVSSGTRVNFEAAESKAGVDGRKADLNTAQHVLAWKPKTPLVTGLEKTVEWYRQRLTDYPDDAS
jgi:nucleoside-diphosphate-sugar epimerase